MSHINSFLRWDTILDLINLWLSYIDLNNLWIIRVENIINWTFYGNDKCSGILVKLDIRRSYNLNVLLHIFDWNDSSSIKTNLTWKHHASNINTTIFWLSELVYHQRLYWEKFDYQYFFLVPGKTNTNMSLFWIQ